MSSPHFSTWVSGTGAPNGEHVTSACNRHRLKWGLAPPKSPTWPTLIFTNFIDRQSGMVVDPLNVLFGRAVHFEETSRVSGKLPELWRQSATSTGSNSKILWTLDMKTWLQEDVRRHPTWSSWLLGDDSCLVCFALHRLECFNHSQ